MTEHRMINIDSKKIDIIPDKSVNLIVTSPPYPMINMWDEMFIEQDNEIKENLIRGGYRAFIKMHNILNKVWKECDRVLKDDGFICINIGDATRTLNNKFQLYSNHTMIINYFVSLGYDVLPNIHWRKQSNAPNKFMGSGMYPCGAYITYECEYILIFRKGKRIFSENEKYLRRKSAYFWEERNIWFSDLWEIKGINQKIKSLNKNNSRTRSGAYPLEIPYRLINMYSIEKDVVLDPFCGTGTTNLACMMANRNSIGIDIDKNILNIAIDNLLINSEKLNKIIDTRINNHIEFIKTLSDEKKEKCYINKQYNFLVKTKQETNIKIDKISKIEKNNSSMYINDVYCKYSNE